MTVKESHEILINDESDKLIEQDKIIKAAKISTENNGIVFLDEIEVNLNQAFLELVHSFCRFLFRNQQRQL